MGNLRISRLDPFLNKYDVLRVGGRLCESYLNNSCMHPARECVFSWTIVAILLVLKMS